MYKAYRGTYQIRPKCSAVQGLERAGLTSYKLRGLSQLVLDQNRQRYARRNEAIHSNRLTERIFHLPLGANCSVQPQADICLLTQTTSRIIAETKADSKLNVILNMPLGKGDILHR